MSLLKKRSVPNLEVSGVHNPYLAARREWDERYGDLVTRARNWRTMAALCSLIALVATAGIVWLSARSRVVPFVVLVDNLGRPVLRCRGSDIVERRPPQAIEHLQLGRKLADRHDGRRFAAKGD